MKLVFINRFFHPDQSATALMLGDLLAGIDRTAHECLVIASSSIHTHGDDVDDELPQYITVKRTWGLAQGGSSLAARLVNFVLFYLGVLTIGMRQIGRGDLVVCLTDPPLISVPVQFLARIKGARVVNWLQDIYPETATTLGFGSQDNALIRLLRLLRNRSWNHAHANICIGQRMKERVAHCGVPNDKLHVIPNWAEENSLAPLPSENNPLRSEWNLPDDSVIVGYSGNLGRAHDVDTMLDAGRRLVAEGETHLQFLFVGGGVKHALLPTPADEPKVAPYFQVRGYRPRSELRLSLAVADIHWLSLEPELEGLIVPSKFYGVIAAGRPIIFIGDTDGEIAQLISRAECGNSFRKGDVEGLANYIRMLGSDVRLRKRLGANGRDYCETHLTRAARIADWNRILREVGEGTAGARGTMP